MAVCVGLMSVVSVFEVCVCDMCLHCQCVCVGFTYVVPEISCVCLRCYCVYAFFYV